MAAAGPSRAGKRSIRGNHHAEGGGSGGFSAGRWKSSRLGALTRGRHAQGAANDKIVSDARELRCLFACFCLYRASGAWEIVPRCRGSVALACQRFKIVASSSGIYCSSVEGLSCAVSTAVSPRGRTSCDNRVVSRCLNPDFTHELLKNVECLLVAAGVVTLIVCYLSLPVLVVVIGQIKTAAPASLKLSQPPHP